MISRPTHRGNRYAVGCICLLFSFAMQASVAERAVQIAETFTEEALKVTYGVDAVSLSVRTEQYPSGSEPQRIWITVASQSDPCGNSGSEEIGEIYVQFVKNQLYSVQWLPAHDPKVRESEVTRRRMLQWARKAWDLDEQVSEKSVPSTTPTQHLVFSRRGEKRTVTIVIDREYGFIHRSYLSPE